MVLHTRSGARINNDKELEREVRSRVGRWLMGKSFIYFGDAMKHFGIEGHKKMNEYGIKLIKSFDLEEVTDLNDLTGRIYNLENELEKLTKIRPNIVQLEEK